MGWVRSGIGSVVEGGRGGAGGIKRGRRRVKKRRGLWRDILVEDNHGEVRGERRWWQQIRRV